MMVRITGWTNSQEKGGARGGAADAAKNKNKNLAERQTKIK
jgi:hypothetical protein